MLIILIFVNFSQVFRRGISTFSHARKIYFFRRSVKAIAEPAVRREIPSEANCSDVRLAGSVVRRATTWIGIGLGTGTGTGNAQVPSVSRCTTFHKGGDPIGETWETYRQER